MKKKYKLGFLTEPHQIQVLDKTYDTHDLAVNGLEGMPCVCGDFVVLEFYIKEYRPELTKK